jgi:CRISPR-associated endonuclease Csn1
VLILIKFMNILNLPNVQRILALDLGIGSYGIALQERSGEGDQKQFSFPIVRSCTLPGDYAELAAVRTRRRMWRTRQAHKAREAWLREVFQKCGLGEAVLNGRRLKQIIVEETGPNGNPVQKQRWAQDADNPPDYRLEREFPPRLGTATKDNAPSDESGARLIYNGAALRCLLLLGREAQEATQGQPLLPWQVFKALHSAIQKRGYDPKVPWARKSNKPVATEEETPGKKATRSKEKATSGATEEPDDQEQLSEEEKKERKEEQASLARALTMQGIVEGLSPDERHHFPCFWEAHRMGLWNPAEPTVVHARLTHEADSCKWADLEDPANKFKPANERGEYAKLPAIFPRRMVEAELVALCEAAANLLPQLSMNGYEIAYGPLGIPYPNIPRRDEEAKKVEEQRQAALAALPEEERKKYVRGKAVEWQGALAQKAPTFDNRGPSPCVLIPRYKVAKCDLRYDKDGLVSESALAAEVSFLLNAKNFRFTPGFRDAFTAEELRNLHAEHFLKTVVPNIGGSSEHALMVNRKNLLTPWLEKNIGPDTRPKPGLEGKGKAALEKPKATGRARFSRPALRLVKELILSGLAPKEFKAALLDLTNTRWSELRKAVRLVKEDGLGFNEVELKGLLPDDLDFLDNLGLSWEKISIRDERLEAISEKTQAEQEARQAAITRMIGMEINPKIRHRLTLLDTLLDDVVKEQGVPDKVVLEFAREEWLGPKRRKELMEFQNQRKQENITARMNLGGDASPKALLKTQLLEEQAGRCLFCGKQFSRTDTVQVVNGELSFDNAHLAHIVADSKGGPRAYVNLVLACDGCNRSQKERYHADVFALGDFKLGWDTFTGIVENLPGMRPFKKKILCTKSEDEAAQMVQNKTALQETAWIAKLARVLISLKFGWKLDAEGEKRNIVVVTGSVTNRVAMKYELYSLLGGPERLQKLAKDKQAIDQMIESVTNAQESELEELGKKMADTWKSKKRKGDDHWERDHMLWLLRRLKISNEDALNEKDRSDDRHHALDAMILSFLPHWSGNPGKSLRFGLPPQMRTKEAFRPYLDKLYPTVLISQKPELEESFYGARRLGAGSAATKRYILREIAYSGINPKFSPSTLSKRAKNIYDPHIRAAVVAFANEEPKEQAWLDYCAKLAAEGLKTGGPRIKNVRCVVSEQLTEYEDFSKDGTGAWRRGDKNQGWFICEKKDKEGEYAIEPVYVHQSKLKLEQRILNEGRYKRVVGYFVRDEVVSLAEPITGIKDPVPTGAFLIRSMWEDRRVELSNNAGYIYNPVNINRLIACGFKKVTTD